MDSINPDAAQELPAAIKKTGHDIKDVKHVIMGHLHLDHAGGLAVSYLASSLGSSKDW